MLTGEAAQLGATQRHVLADNASSLVLGLSQLLPTNQPEAMNFDTHEALKVEIRRLVLPEQEHRYLNDPEYYTLVQLLARANVLDQRKRAPERAPKQR